MAGKYFTKGDNFMIRTLLGFLQKNSNEIPLAKEQIDGALKVIDTYDSVFGKFILIFFTLFMFNFFMFSAMFSISLTIFAFISHFGDLSQIADIKDLPENMTLYLALAGVGTAVLSYVFFKIMKKIWSKVKLTKKKELKLEL